MSSVIFDRFGADSPANYGVFAIAAAHACPDLPVAVIRVRRDGALPLDGANIAAAQLLGYELPRRLIRATPQELFVDPADFSGIVSSLLFAKDASASRDCRIRRKNGSYLWVSVHAQTVRDAQHEPGHINLVLVDISDRKCVEQALRESDDRFRSMLSHAAEGILLIDPVSGQVLSANPRAEQMLGYSDPEMARLSLNTLHPADALPRIEQLLHQQARGEISRERDIPLLRGDGTILNADLYAFACDLDGRKAMVAFYHDASDRKQAEGEAREYQERLRSLALELSLAEERERRRLAGHLHDEVGQLLSLAQIRLSMIEPSVMRPECRKGAHDMKKLLDRALRATRSLTFQLSHPAVYDLGFVAGAEWLVEDVKDLFGLDAQLINDPSPKTLELRSRVLLLQCIRELLVNVAKHAGVLCARVHLTTQGGCVRVVVADQGKGFDSTTLPKATGKSGFGLFSIRERLRSLGGAVEIVSIPGKGTCVTLDVPMSCDGSREVST